MSATAAVTAPAARHSRAGDFAELIKARLTLLVLLTTAVGYYMASDWRVNFVGLLHAFIGTAFAAGGAAALNQWWERNVDALMRRTESRPLPAGRMTMRAAAIIGVFLSIGGVAYLAVTCTALSAILAAITVAIYVFAYTPLKRVSTSNTLVGAIPGALPPMIGWAAVHGRVGVGAWTLFAIVFLWQMPHFFAIAWMYRDDYARAGFQMISNDDETAERSASQSVLFAMMLLVIGGMPAFIGLTNGAYLVAELILGGGFIFVAMRFLKRRDRAGARALFFASIIYLPLLLAALVATKT